MSFLLTPFIYSNVFGENNLLEQKQINNEVNKEIKNKKKVCFSSNVSVLLIPDNNEYSDLEKLNMYYSGGDYLYFKKMGAYFKNQEECGCGSLDINEIENKEINERNTAYNKFSFKQPNRHIKIMKKSRFIQYKNKMYIKKDPANREKLKMKINNINFNQFF